MYIYIHICILKLYLDHTIRSALLGPKASLPEAFYIPKPDMIFFSTPIWNQPMRFLNEQTSVGGLNHIGWAGRKGWIVESVFAVFETQIGT